MGSNWVVVEASAGTDSIPDHLEPAPAEIGIAAEGKSQVQVPG